MLKRVVVTGMGMISPLGSSMLSSWQSLINGGSGIISLKHHPNYKENKDYPECYIAPVHSSFDYAKWRVPLTTNLTNSLLMAAAEEAIIDSKLKFEKEQDKERAGVIIGSMNSNIPRLTDSISGAALKGFGALNRLTMLNVLTNMGAANLSIKFQLKGPSLTTSNACSTGASAIGEGFKNIQLGEADVMLVGGADEVVNPVCIYSSMKMQAMSTKTYSSAREASRPFDKDRSGFILGEGAGILILEELQHALERNATIYAELLGYGCKSDAYHLTKPNEDGDGGFRAMKRALEQANLTPSDIDHINCHATSTPVGDNAEAKAIAKLLESRENIKKTSITACKGAIGHCFAGAGSIETIFALLSMNQSLAPPILNLKSIPEVDLNYVTEETARKQEINCVIKNSFGFGGINVALLFKKIKI